MNCFEIIEDLRCKDLMVLLRRFEFFNYKANSKIQLIAQAKELVLSKESEVIPILFKIHEDRTKEKRVRKGPIKDLQNDRPMNTHAKKDVTVHSKKAYSIQAVESSNNFEIQDELEQLTGKRLGQGSSMPPKSFKPSARQDDIHSLERMSYTNNNYLGMTLKGTGEKEIQTKEFHKDFQNHTILNTKALVHSKYPFRQELQSNHSIGQSVICSEERNLQNYASQSRNTALPEKHDQMQEVIFISDEVDYYSSDITHHISPSMTTAPCTTSSIPIEDNQGSINLLSNQSGVSDISIHHHQENKAINSITCPAVNIQPSSSCQSNSSYLVNIFTHAREKKIEFRIESFAAFEQYLIPPTVLHVNSPVKYDTPDAVYVLSFTNPLYSLSETDDSKLVFIRMTQEKSQSNLLYDDILPQDFLLKVNDRIIRNPNRKKKRSRVGLKCAGVPIDITKYLCTDSAINIVKISIFGQRDESPFIIAALLVSKISVKDLFESVKAKKSECSTKELINDIICRTNDYIDNKNTITISLICPIGLKLISTPVRSSNCVHLQCFDLETYLKITYVTPKWYCPICGNGADLENLEIDSLILSILNSMLHSADSVTFCRDGSYKINYKTINKSQPKTMAYNLARQ